jgi:mannosyltransferase
MEPSDLARLDVIIPNLHRRYSGVTAANRAVAPHLARLCPTAWFGSDRPAGVARLTLRDLFRLRFGSLRRRPRVWHARRNDEMIVGWLLVCLGWPLRLVFTSAAQRHHTWITRRLMERMDAIIATSDLSASYLDRKARVILHGVDTTVFHPPPDRQAAFAEAKLPGRYGIGCFGRVRPQKGTDVFVKAMCELLPRYPDFTAIVTGAADDAAFLRGLQAQVDAAGLAERVRFLGEVPTPDMTRWYQRITIYAFTSRNEGFGLTLLEAMASGVALVAARAGAAEKLVTDGETGILVPPGDVAALIAALEPLMRAPQRALEMGSRAREDTVRRFSIDAECRQTAKVYRAVLGR